MSDFEMPPASIEMLSERLRMEAEVHLGLLHFGPEEEKPQPNFPLARHTIDLLAVLLEKTKGNLTLGEQRAIENALTELRFRYVQVFNEAGKHAAAGAETAGPAPPESGAGESREES